MEARNASSFAGGEVWLADAAWWWRDPRGYEVRSRRLDTAVFAFFLFMMVNGAVVFATSPMRFAGALAVGLVVIARLRHRRGNGPLPA